MLTNDRNLRGNAKKADMGRALADDHAALPGKPDSGRGMIFEILESPTTDFANKGLRLAIAANGCHPFAIVKLIQQSKTCDDREP
jgi:hypothetical protein